MKKVLKTALLAFIVLLSASTAINAQKTFVVKGNISNGFPNQTVWINFVGTPFSCFVQDTTTTDSLGNYSHSFTSSSGCSYSTIVVSVPDCKLYDTLIETRLVDTLSAGPDTLIANFKYCDTCTLSANFIDSSFGRLTNFFGSFTQGTAQKFKWYFGDGQTSTLQNPTHVYPNAYTNYTACFVVTDTISGCKDSICKSIDRTRHCSLVTANFINTTGSSTVIFTNLSSSFTNTYHWDFGNGNTSTQKNPTSIYNSPGTYNVCLVASDSVYGCRDTICKNITISTNPCAGFSANFSDTVNGLMATFVSAGLTSSSANKFTWTFGNSQTSTAQNPTITYNTGGTYTVCLVAEDTVNRCKDSICKTITVSNPCAGFNADFDFTISCDTVKFIDSSSSSVNSFSWTFGNGQSSTAKNPTQVYNSSGVYTICLTVQDTTKNCIDSICKTITLNNYLSGTVFRNNNQKADSGRVWLIEVTVDSLTNDTILTAVDSAYFNSSTNATYNFSNVPSGDYLIKAALDSGAAFYNNRLPTYYDKETRWDKATKITVNKPCVTTDIVLKAGNNPGGAGFIGGLVKQGANKFGDPLQKILVILYNADGSPFGFDYTDINGAYEFDNIAYGSYTVVVDVLGKPSDEYNVTINANYPNDDRGNFEVNTKDVKLIPFIPGSVNTLTKSQLKLYPNPTKTSVVAQFTTNKAVEAKISITDITGKTVLTDIVNAQAGENEIKLNVAYLSSGFYMVIIETDTGLYLGRLTISE